MFSLVKGGEKSPHAFFTFFTFPQNSATTAIFKINTQNILLVPFKLKTRQIQHLGVFQEANSTALVCSGEQATVLLLVGNKWLRTAFCTINPTCKTGLMVASFFVKALQHTDEKCCMQNRSFSSFLYLQSQ